jgi:hypothetical protein
MNPFKAKNSNGYMAGLRVFMGGLAVAIPLIPAVTLAQTSLVNPCPRIYYEEPFNSTRAVPQGCPPNAATQQQNGQTGQTIPTTPAPLPGTIAPSSSAPEPAPSAVISPTNGTVSIQLVNATNTDVTYQVIGDTNSRSLSGNSQITLQGLNVPINMTFVRPDSGFVSVTPREISPGVLQVTLTEAQTVDQGQGALSIEQNGNVYLN